MWFYYLPAQVSYSEVLESIPDTVHKAWCFLCIQMHGLFFTSTQAGAVKLQLQHGFRFSEMLRCVNWLLLAGVSGGRISPFSRIKNFAIVVSVCWCFRGTYQPIFKDQAFCDSGISLRLTLLDVCRDKNGYCSFQLTVYSPLVHICTTFCNTKKGKAQIWRCY